MDEDNWYPVWTYNEPGMQGKLVTNRHELRELNGIWDIDKTRAMMTALTLLEKGVHKQNANRVLEPYSRTLAVVTATDYDNFFKLRSHPDALAEIREVSDAMQEALKFSEPEEIDEWHIPYIWPDEQDLPIETRLKVSVARCARVSYRLHDGARPTIEKDLKLYEQLYNEGHMSPFAHQGRVLPHDSLDNHQTYSHITANFRGFGQYRRYVETNSVDFVLGKFND